MSIKINAFCRKDRISTDQTTIVYLRFTKNRRSRYVSTGIRVPISEWNFENQAPQPSNQHLHYQIYEQIESYQRQIRRMEVLDMPITLEAILSSDKHAAGCTIASFLQQVIEQTERETRLSSASRYKVILAQLKQAHLSHLHFEELTLNHLHQFEHVLRKLGNKPNSIVTKMSVFKAIYNRALSNRVFICSENPFVRYNIGKLREIPQKRAVHKEDVLRLMEAPLPQTLSLYTELSRDLFLFSYFSAGINFKDIAMLRYSDIRDGRIYYCRKKTGKKMNCRLIPQTQAIIDKYAQPDRTNDDYIFPILDCHMHKTPQQISNRLHKVLAHINRELKQWGVRLGLDTKLTTYVARHTYATVLKRSGVNIAIISESLGHSELSTTQIYLDSFENTQIDEAMRNLM